MEQSKWTNGLLRKGLTVDRIQRDLIRLPRAQQGLGDEDWFEESLRSSGGKSLDRTNKRKRAQSRKLGTDTEVSED